MNYKAITTSLLVSLMWMPISACRHQGLSTSEFNELRRVAFAEATKRYVLSDADIESQYSQKMAVVCPPKPAAPAGTSARPVQRKGLLDFSDLETSEKKANESSDECGDRLICEAARKRVRIQAVASVRGVELSPSKQVNLYFIKFDFEPNQNPHTELPKNQATAERFERPDGTRYWVISW